MHIIKTLQNTRAEKPISEDNIDEWVDRLTTLGDELDNIRDGAEPSLLTEREAEVIVRWYGTTQGAEEIADAIDADVSTQRVYNLRYAAEEDLLAADATLSIIGDLRRNVRSEPYEDGVWAGDANE
jgi:predicted DNA-binding protein YlxM (UPF0122 family)